MGHPAAFTADKQGVGLEEERSGHQPVAKWHVGIAGRGLACYALVPSPDLLNFELVVVLTELDQINFASLVPHPGCTSSLSKK